MNSDQQMSRHQFLRQSTTAASAAVAVCISNNQRAVAQHTEVDRSVIVRSPSLVRQADIVFDSKAYTAFPHVARLDGDELFMAFRQAPVQERIRHTHPRSVITIIRSYDLGETRDIENAGQFAAGGGRSLHLFTWSMVSLADYWPCTRSFRSGNVSEPPFRILAKMNIRSAMWVVSGAGAKTQVSRGRRILRVDRIRRPTALCAV